MLILHDTLQFLEIFLVGKAHNLFSRNSLVYLIQISINTCCVLDTGDAEINQEVPTFEGNLKV